MLCSACTLHKTHLRIVLRVSRMQRNGFEIESAIQIHRGNDVSRNHATRVSLPSFKKQSKDMTLLQSRHNPAHRSTLGLSSARCRGGSVGNHPIALLRPVHTVHFPLCLVGAILLA